MGESPLKSLRNRLFTEGWAVSGAVLVSIAIVVVLSALGWDWLRTSSQTVETTVATDEGTTARRSTTTYTEPASTAIRNVGFVLAGLIAGIIAAWRGRVADRQAQAARAQTEIAQQALRNERFQKGVEMLGHSILSVRLGGIYALDRLGADFPDQYHVEVAKVLCAFVSSPQEDPEIEKQSEKGKPTNRARQDVQAAMVSISSRSEADAALEKEANYTLDLFGASLFGTRLENGNLSDANLEGANLSGSILRCANLSGTNLRHANLSSPWVIDDSKSRPPFPVLGWDTDLSYVNLSNAKLNSADMRGVLLEHANLSLTDLLVANLSNAKLTGSTLSRATLVGADLTDAILSGVQADRANLIGTNFVGTNLSGADLSGLTRDENLERPVNL